MMAVYNCLPVCHCHCRIRVPLLGIELELEIHPIHANKAKRLCLERVYLCLPLASLGAAHIHVTRSAGALGRNAARIHWER